MTLNIELRTLRAAFFYAVRWEMLKANPFSHVPLCRIPERSPAFFTASDFQALISTIKERWLRSVIVLAACTGMRRGEIANLKWGDISTPERVVRIQSDSTFRTKAGKRRVIPLNNAAVRLLSELRQCEQTEYVVTLNGKKIRDVWITRRFKQYLRRLGFKEGYHFHSLRHTFASWLVQNSVPIYEVQQLMGHSSVRVTEIYSHLAPSQLHSTVEGLSRQLPSC